MIIPIGYNVSYLYNIDTFKNICATSSRYTPVLCGGERFDHWMCISTFISERTRSVVPKPYRCMSARLLFFQLMYSWLGLCCESTEIRGKYKIYTVTLAFETLSYTVSLFSFIAGSVWSFVLLSSPTCCSRCLKFRPFGLPGPL